MTSVEQDMVACDDLSDIAADFRKFHDIATDGKPLLKQAMNCAEAADLMRVGAEVERQAWPDGYRLAIMNLGGTLVLAQYNGSSWRPWMPTLYDILTADWYRVGPDPNLPPESEGREYPPISTDDDIVPAPARQAEEPTT